MRICPKKINEGSEENILVTKSFSRGPRRPMQGPSFRLKRTHYLGARQCGSLEPHDLDKKAAVSLRGFALRLTLTHSAHSKAQDFFRR